MIALIAGQRPSAQGESEVAALVAAEAASVHIPPMEKTFLVLAGVYGALAVGLGAYGAHGLERALEGVPDLAKKLGWWQTAVGYHLPHAVALGLAAWLVSRGDGWAPRLAGFSFAGGVALFSGSLYAMALGAPRWLGAVTPLGGLALIVGWLAVALAAFRA